MKPLRYLHNVTTLRLDLDLCIACGRCMEVCPHVVFAVTDSGKPRIVNRDACMECGACAKNCPVAAVTVRPGVGCAAAVFNAIFRGTGLSCDCGGTGPGKSCCGGS